MARRWLDAPPPPADYQRHHLVTVALLRRPQMAALFRHLQYEGFSLHQFARNGLMLPASEAAALRSGHALHRGPHRGYSDVIAARIDRVRVHFEAQATADMVLARRTAVMRIALLQDVRRRALTDRHGGGFWLNRRGPMRLFADRPYLDEAIDGLFAGQPMNLACNA